MWVQLVFPVMDPSIYLYRYMLCSHFPAQPFESFQSCCVCSRLCLVYVTCNSACCVQHMRDSGRNSVPHASHWPDQFIEVYTKTILRVSLQDESTTSSCVYYAIPCGCMVLPYSLSLVRLERESLIQ